MLSVKEKTNVIIKEPSLYVLKIIDQGSNFCINEFLLLFREVFGDYVSSVALDPHVVIDVLLKNKSAICTTPISKDAAETFLDRANSYIKETGSCSCGYSIKVLVEVV